MAGSGERQLVPDTSHTAQLQDFRPCIGLLDCNGEIEEGTKTMPNERRIVVQCLG